MVELLEVSLALTSLEQTQFLPIILVQQQGECIIPKPCDGILVLPDGHQIEVRISFACGMPCVGETGVRTWPISASVEANNSDAIPSGTKLLVPEITYEEIHSQST